MARSECKKTCVPAALREMGDTAPLKTLSMGFIRTKGLMFYGTLKKGDRGKNMQ